MKNLTLLALLAAVNSSNAALLSHNGYELNTETNIIIGQGLDWLQWDETTGISAATALDTYGSAGWRLASNTEMASLFNDFSFGTEYGTSYDTDENSYQMSWLQPVVNNQGSASQFNSLFGDTYAASGFPFDPDIPYASKAIFGEDSDNDGALNYAVVELHNDPYDNSDYLSGFIALQDDVDSYSSSEATSGVALVRTSEIPLPAAGYLFGMSLAALIFGDKLRKH